MTSTEPERPAQHATPPAEETTDPDAQLTGEGELLASSDPESPHVAATVVQRPGPPGPSASSDPRSPRVAATVVEQPDDLEQPDETGRGSSDAGG